VSERPRERESDGWMDEGGMRIFSSSFHPQLSFRIHLIFILVATVVATIYHSPKKEKTFFFLFPFSTQFFKLSFSFHAWVSFFPH
jgi:hypothetical protein